jgi:Short C-terminal domain
MANIKMRLSGSVWLSNSFKQSLVITDEGVEGEVIQGMKRVKMLLPFDRIAQVNLSRGIFAASLQVINKGGAGNLVVKGLKKDKAEQAKALIESEIQAALRDQRRSNDPSHSAADELVKLAELRDRGIITSSEFESQKAKALKAS